jgi:hypothetical protein
MTTGSRKQATGLLTSLRGMTKFWSGLRETRRDRQVLFPGKGRRFKSGQPHHQPINPSVLDFLFWLKKKGYREATLQGYSDVFKHF